MKPLRITVIEGDGIGPVIVEATLQVLEKLNCGLVYDFATAGISALEREGELLPQKTLDLIAHNRITLKGPLTTPIGGGFTSMNVTLRKRFELFANVRPVISLPGVPSRYEQLDIITVRENTEGMYSGEGQILSEDGNRAEAKSVITRKGATRVLRFAYELALKKGRRKMTVVHKANILKTTSGLFLKIAREIAAEYPQIETVEMIVDNCCMQLVLNPQQFDMIVTTNLFGDIISDLCAGLVGGLGMAPGANIGENAALFEAVHGSAPDLAGKNLANPTAIMLAAALMLDYVGQPEKGERLRQAVAGAIASGDRCTRDLGGQAGTTDFTAAVLERI